MEVYAAKITKFVKPNILMPNDKFLKIEIFQLLHLDDVDACRVIADIQFYGLAVGLDVADSLAKQVEDFHFIDE